MPTFTVLYANAWPHDASFTEDPRLRYMPAHVRKHLRLDGC